MKHIYRCIFLLACFFVISLKAQSLYIIKLKSGVVLKCELVKMVPDSFVVVKQYDTTTTIFYRDIASIEFAETIVNTPAPEPIPVKGRGKKKIIWRNLPDSNWTFGFRIGISLNQSTRYQDEIFPANSFRISGMKGLNKHVEAGFSVGVDPYLDVFGDGGVLMGIAAGQIRYGFLKDKPKFPFMYGELGYGTSILPDNGNTISGHGVNYAFGIGLSSRSKAQNTIFSVLLGIRTQYANYRFFDWNTGWGWGARNSVVTHEPLSGLELRLEWRF